MRVSVRVLAVGALTLALAVPALGQRQGQRGGGGFFGGGGQQMLLLNKSVQQELKLTDDQVKKIDTAVQEVREKYRAEREELRDVQDQQERREKQQALGRKVAGDTQKALAGILQPDQEKRFKQIELQQQGVRAFQQSEVQSALKLTDDQKDKLKTIQDDSAREMREAFQSAGRENRQEAMKKIASLRKESMDNALAVLTPDQKKTWEEMTGKPFEIKFEGPPGGRGRRGGNRRQQ